MSSSKFVDNIFQLSMALPENKKEFQKILKVTYPHFSSPTLTPHSPHPSLLLPTKLPMLRMYLANSVLLLQSMYESIKAKPLEFSK